MIGSRYVFIFLFCSIVAIIHAQKTQQQIVHKVAMGETLQNISILYEVPLESIVSWNRIVNNQIFTNQPLIIKNVNNYPEEFIQFLKLESELRSNKRLIHENEIWLEEWLKQSEYKIMSLAKIDVKSVRLVQEYLFKKNYLTDSIDRFNSVLQQRVDFLEQSRSDFIESTDEETRAIIAVADKKNIQKSTSHIKEEVAREVSEFLKVLEAFKQSVDAEKDTISFETVQIDTLVILPDTIVVEEPLQDTIAIEVEEIDLTTEPDTIVFDFNLAEADSIQIQEEIAEAIQEAALTDTLQIAKDTISDEVDFRVEESPKDTIVTTELAETEPIRLRQRDKPAVKEPVIEEPLVKEVLVVKEEEVLPQEDSIVIEKIAPKVELVDVALEIQIEKEVPLNVDSIKKIEADLNEVSSFYFEIPLTESDEEEEEEDDTEIEFAYNLPEKTDEVPVVEKTEIEVIKTPETDKKEIEKLALNEDVSTDSLQVDSLTYMLTDEGDTVYLENRQIEVFAIEKHKASKVEPQQILSPDVVVAKKYIVFDYQTVVAKLSSDPKSAKQNKKVIEQIEKEFKEEQDVFTQISIDEITIKSDRKSKYKIGDEVDTVSIEKSKFYLSRAKIEIDNGNFKKCHDYINKSIAANPNYVEAYMLRGDVFAKFTYFDRALKEYEIARQLNPNLAQIHYNIGNCLIHLGNKEQALESMNNAIRVDSTYVMGYFVRSSLLLDTKQYDLAIEDFNTILKLNRFFFPAMKGRGLALLNTGDFAQAIEDFDRSLEYDPDDSKTYYHRGLAKIYSEKVYGGCMDLLKSSEMGFPPGILGVKKYCN
jgi:tetratricopeptide (TPR) repeat protein